MPREPSSADPHEADALPRAALAALWQRASAASSAARFAELERVMTEASALAVRLHGENHAETARALNELAYALRRQGNYAAAEPVLRRLIAIQETLEGPEHPSLGLLLDLLAAAVSRVHPGRMSEVKKLESRAAHLRLRRR
ncbi:MAG: tetratricopeptide repeat protein [bacterium]